MKIKVSENQIRNITKQVLKEYLDKDYLMPLRKYMAMDETDQAWECACRLPWLFTGYINDNMEALEAVENLIEKGEVPEDILQWDDYEAAEKLSEFLKTDLKPFCEDFIQYATRYGDREVPLFCAADFRREVHNEWLVHMTNKDNIPGLYREGFSYGVDIDNLAYTPGIGTTQYKYGAGYDFAFEADDASIAEKSGYGDCAILFQASGIQIYHWGDEQYQVIFYGPSARNLIFLFQDDETNMWYVDSEITGRRLVEFETLEFLVQWCISNFPQYHNHLIGKNSQYKKFERNIAKRKEVQYKNVSEGIFSKYMKLINNN